MKCQDSELFDMANTHL